MRGPPHKSLGMRLVLMSFTVLLSAMVQANPCQDMVKQAPGTVYLALSHL